MAGIIEFVASGVDCITARKHTSIYTCQLRLFITHGSMVYLLVSNHCLEAHRVLFSSSTRCSVSSLSLSHSYMDNPDYLSDEACLVASRGSRFNLENMGSGNLKKGGLLHFSKDSKLIAYPSTFTNFALIIHFALVIHLFLCIF